MKNKKKKGFWWPTDCPRPVVEHDFRRPWTVSSTQTPGPDAYETIPPRTTGTGRRFFGSGKRKIEIESAEGRDSPGPVYMIDNEATSLTRKSPVVGRFARTVRPDVFGTGKRLQTPASTDYNTSTPTSIPGGVIPKETPPSFFKIAKASSTPGPNAYLIEDKFITSQHTAPSFSFANSKGHDLDIVIKDMIGPISTSQDLSCDPAVQQEVVKPRTPATVFSKATRGNSDLPGTLHITPGPGDYNPVTSSFLGTKGAKFGTGARKFTLSMVAADKLIAGSSQSTTTPTGTYSSKKGMKWGKGSRFGPSGGAFTPHTESPGPAYKPTDSLVAKSGRSFGFGREERHTGGISIGGRMFKSPGLYVPGPQSYSPQMDSDAKAATFGKATRNSPDASTNPNKAPPGPGQYNAPSAFNTPPKPKYKKSSTFGHSTREIYAENKAVRDNPGPADHDPVYTVTKPRAATPSFVKERRGKVGKGFEPTAEPAPGTYSPEPVTKRAPTPVLYLTG
eukprot:TRINITY_DN70717_c0_g1_i1.p1 TRINITY_DN70717_c0_g1~~TRINITY_DN70717_c0_g1_i1.p1  ORF type:complete len:505 (-),score=36.48 TRINITY_DN70717_c0_g1_i1:81-1595(-)